MRARLAADVFQNSVGMTLRDPPSATAADCPRRYAARTRSASELAPDAEIGDRRLVELGRGPLCHGEQEPSPLSGRVLPVMMSIVGRLAGAVGADDGAHLAWRDLERQVVDGPEAVEATR